MEDNDGDKRSPRDGADVRDEADVPEHIGQNIQTIAALFAKAQRRVDRHQRAIERVTNAFGRPATIYVLFVVISVWVTGNGLAPYFGYRAIDAPPFQWLQGAACVSALLLTSMILTTQNRLAKVSLQRAHLDLQINLITEEKISKVIALVEELRRDLPAVTNRKDPLADTMTAAVDVHAVAEELEGIDVDKPEP